MKKLDSLITYTDPNTHIAEEFRVLRTNIFYCNVDNLIKTITVTSAHPGEGKTTVSSNLSVVFAQSGCKVLIVDADFRRPQVHNFFGVDNDMGLTSILMKQSELSDCIKKSNIENLDIITSGPIPPNPSEIVASKAFKQFLGELYDNYDYIIIDSPPVMLFADTIILSTLSDGVILVAAAGKVDRAAARKTKSLLQNINANVLGVVLNQVQKKPYHYQNYYYYYNLSEHSGWVTRLRKIFTIKKHMMRIKSYIKNIKKQ